MLTSGFPVVTDLQAEICAMAGVPFLVWLLVPGIVLVAAVGLSADHEQLVTSRALAHLPPNDGGSSSGGSRRLRSPRQRLAQLQDEMLVVVLGPLLFIIVWPIIAVWLLSLNLVPAVAWLCVEVLRIGVVVIAWFCLRRGRGQF